jgi:hypothetical protein
MIQTFWFYSHPMALNNPCPLRRKRERLPPRMDAKKGKTRKESTPIKVWLTPEEKAAIAEKADAHSLSASGYLRRLGLALPVGSTIGQRAILDLVKINADLGRFGALIKIWLTSNADFQSLSAHSTLVTDWTLPQRSADEFLITLTAVERAWARRQPAVGVDRGLGEPLMAFAVSM